MNEVHELLFSYHKLFFRIGPQSLSLEDVMNELSALGSARLGSSNRLSSTESSGSILWYGTNGI